METDCGQDGAGPREPTSHMVPQVCREISGTPEITHTRGRGQLHDLTYSATLTPRAGEDPVPSLGAQG